MKVLIVDDEINARRKVRLFLEQLDADVIGECADRASAVNSIRLEQPDLVFLDVQLRGSTAFDIVDEVGAAAMPATIFTTAYDEHAVRAFELNAVDYLLKPYTQERFAEAFHRATQRTTQRDFDRLLAAVTAARANAEPQPQALRWILVRQLDGSSVLVRVADVDWIEAAGNYVYLHCGPTRYLHRHALGGLLEHLDAQRFVRVHRSAAVNLDSVVRIAPLFAGDQTVHLRSGATVRLSRNYRTAFDDAIGANAIRPERD